MRKDFVSPSGVVRENTGPLFWLHGTESEVRLREYVRRIAESGQGMLTIESRPHKEWMKEGWWRDVDIVLDECRRRGLKLIVFDDYFFPSQYMGGKFPIPKEYSCRDVRGKVYARNAAPAKASNEVARITVREVGKGGSVTASPYSESVATELAFTLPALGAGERVYLVCDGTEGEKSAAVEVNGAYAGGFIGAPFRLDVTKSVRAGDNRLVARPFRLKNPRIVMAKPN